MKRTMVILLSLFLLVGLGFGGGCVPKVDPVVVGNEYARYPFPTRIPYVIEPMLPTDKTQEEIDGMIISLFREFMVNDLIVDSLSPANKDDFRMVYRHYLSWEIDEGEIEVSHLNVSESQGYGMMMIAYMAGCEEALALKPEQWIYGCSRLQEYYDAMLRTVIHYPSVVGNKMFCWELTGYDRNGDNQTGYKEINGVKSAPFTQDPEDGDSATDGDMDIIYSLLLADKQWGSDGRYNYKEIALGMLDDFWDFCVHKEYHTLLLGDWAVAIDDKVLADATRCSDFILSHLKVFAEVDQKHDWNKVITATYGVIQDVRDAENKKGNKNGLLPDFVVRSNDKWMVPKGEVLEGEEDNTYAYNSCRIPWRLGTDYLLYGNTKIGDSDLLTYIVEPLDSFAKRFTKGDLEVLGPVKLNGKLLWDDHEPFASPFIVTAAAVGNDQDWVNTVWDYPGLTDYFGDNYGDYIKFFVMLTASGNYWLPLDSRLIADSQ